MFKRRTPLTPLQLLKEIFWPTMGWIRASRYIQLRIIRLSDSTHRVSAGLATGAATSFTPLLGTHFIQAGGIAYLCRFNVPASLIGTFFGNPWTFPFIWWASMTFGAFILSIFGLPASIALPETMTIGIAFDLMLHDPMRIFLPWLVGGYLLGLISWTAFYGVFYLMIHGAKKARTKARLKKIHKVAKEITGQNT